MGEASTATNTSDSDERRGPVLDVLRDLLRERRDDEILALVKLLLARNSELELRLAQQLSRLRKNEGVSSEQLLLLIDQLSANDDEQRAKADEQLRGASAIDDKRDRDTKDEPAPPRRRPPTLRTPPAHLRRVDNPIPVPADERACPKCGAERECIGHDVSHVIELQPAEVFVRVDRREKLACVQSCESELVRAPLGDKVVEGGVIGSTFAAQILVDKYDDGLPLHRQKQRYGRLGLDISVSTIADQVAWTTELLRPLWRTCVAQVLTARVMHLDATGLPVLDRNVKGRTRLGTLWGYVGDTNVAAYLYTSTGKKNAQREGELGPEEMLSLRRGYTVADASNLFEQSFKRPDLIECGCNTHARRYFVKALDRGDARASLPLAAYKKLYEVEDEAREMDDDARLALRQEKSEHVFATLVEWAQTHKPHEPPASPMGIAIRYLLNHREALHRFLEAGEIPIDNSIVERLHVRAALTRKNYLFAGSDTGGERAAIAYTILGSCRIVGVNPVEYLGDLLPRLCASPIRIMDMPSLLPAAWKQTRAVSTDPPPE